MRFILSITALSAAACCGQSLSVGAVGGVRATDDMAGGGGAISASKHYAIGPAVDIGLPLGFGVEVDALYRREGYQSAWGNFAYSVFSDERANSWEFPVLVKYKLPLRGIRPFLEAGYAPRVIGGSISSDGVTYFGNSGVLPQPVYSHFTASTDWPVSQGVVAGGGVQFGIGRLRLSPAVRYTHWSNAAVSGFYSDGPSFGSARDQVDVLVGISWKLR
jgi:outer membrane protein with beta-barrel domain